MFKQFLPELVDEKENPEFKSLYIEIKPFTFLSPKRIFLLYQFAKRSAKLSGNIAEVGVYKGGSAKLLARVFQNTKKKIFLFDNFSDPLKVNPQYQTKEISGGTDFTSVQSYLREFKNIEFFKGIFPASAKSVKGKFCFVHIDADLYQSTKDALEFFYPKMVSGGIIVCADYNVSKHPGTRKALNDFFRNKKEYPIHTADQQCVVIKI